MNMVPLSPLEGGGHDHGEHHGDDDDEEEETKAIMTILVPIIYDGSVESTAI
jgi:hypothetical protein